MVSLIKSYFPDLTEKQQAQFEAMQPLYAYWNERINVISRKDMENFYEHHVLHSLGIAKVLSFAPETRIMDVGTGGGFPGIPLAILFPEAKFMLVDSIGKKIKVVEAVCHELKLENVEYRQARAEEVRQQFHFIVSRAVTDLPRFISWVKSVISGEHFNTLENGILYLKGGDLTEELSQVKWKSSEYELSTYFAESFFETKKVIYLKKK